MKLKRTILKWLFYQLHTILMKHYFSNNYLVFSTANTCILISIYFTISNILNVLPSDIIDEDEKKDYEMALKLVKVEGV